MILETISKGKKCCLALPDLWVDEAGLFYKWPTQKSHKDAWTNHKYTRISESEIGTMASRTCTSSS